MKILIVTVVKHLPFLLTQWKNQADKHPVMDSKLKCVFELPPSEAGSEKVLKFYLINIFGIGK